LAMNTGQPIFKLAEPRWLLAGAVATALLVASIFFPLWKMKLIAPQYPNGLQMYAYGYKFADSNASDNYDEVREINELNHYIGMKSIKDVVEMKLFIPGAVALAAATVAVSFVAWQRKWLRALVIAGYWTFPLFFIADLQYHLWDYGHTMKEDAPLNIDAFTPKVVGETKVWNFHSDNTFAIGFYLLVAAALIITLLPWFVRWVQAGEPGKEKQKRAGVRRAATGSHAVRFLPVVTLLALVLSGAIALTGPPGRQGPPAYAAFHTLQQQIDQARPGDTITIEGGHFNERVTIDKPLTLIGHGGPVIDGGGQGDVLTITSSDVFVSGFTIRGAGQTMSKEPAAVKVSGATGVTLTGNHIEASRFGIYLLDSHEAQVDHNVIDLGAKTPVERRGHGIYMWQSGHSAVRFNTIRNAADGVHLEFSGTNVISDNMVSDSRYALHFMYANDNKVLRNIFRNNLAGAVLMFSRELILKDNELSSNRAGATGAGMLLKDIDNVYAEGNRVERNKYGITAEGTPQTAGASAVFYRNLIALNDTGLGLMSNAPITFVENSMIDNGVQVKALGGAITSLSGHEVKAPTDAQALPAGGHDHAGAAQPQAAPSGPNGALPAGAAWSANGRGNYWSDYRGYDADGNGVGDKPYQPQPPFAGRLTANDSLRLFQFTPAQQAIDAAADMFPVYRYAPVIEDPAPLMKPPLALAAGSDSPDAGVLLASGGLIALAAAALAWAFGPVGLGRKASLPSAAPSEARA
jgi:nitrous oxidase accessory protein